MATNQQNFRVRNGLTIDGATTGSSSFANPATGSDLSYVLPGTAGAASTVLTNDGSGNLSWAAGGGTGTTYTINSSTTTGGANFNLVGSDATTDTIKFADGTGVNVVATDASTTTISIGQSVATTATPTFAGATLGNVTVGVSTDNYITTTSGNLTVGAGGITSYVELYSSSTNPTLAIRNSSTTNQTVRALTLKATSSGTPTVGFGTNLEFVADTATGVSKQGGYVQIRSTDVTTGSEDFRMDFGLMQNGATYANRLSLFSNGDLNMFNGGKFGILGLTSGYTLFQAPTTGANLTYTLPDAYPASSGYVLSSTTGGTMSWVAQSGGGSSTTDFTPSFLLGGM